MHIPPLFSDLALILIVASCTTLLFKWLKQPVVLGYVVAGIIAGPHTTFFVTVSNLENISLWGEIGVVFLLFALGLEFNLKKLKDVGQTGGITAIFELVIMFGVGFLAGKIMGWELMDCIFLGGMLTISSTTIIIKAFEDLGVKTQKFSSIVFGVLIAEDLVAVLQLVILSTIAISRDFSGSLLSLSVLKLVMFIVFWFVVGIYLIPTFFKKAKKILGEETLLIITIGLCFGMVYLADVFGFSAALGAFLMGAILGETIESEKIHKLILPLKFLFGAIFFVSVGMLVDFNVVVNSYVPILVITLIVLIIKTFTATMGVLISGQSLRVSIQSGFSLSQIGEFSFIIATLGVSLNVINPELYPIIVSVSVITTFTTPYFIKMATPFNKWLHSWLPLTWQHKLDHFSITSNHAKSKTVTKKYVRKFAFRTFVYVVILLSLYLFSIYVLEPFINYLLPSKWSTLVAFLTMLIITVPVLLSMLVNKLAPNTVFTKLWLENEVRKPVLVLLIIVRVIIIIIFVTVTMVHFFHIYLSIFSSLICALLILLISRSHKVQKAVRIEERFFENLKQRSSLPHLKVPHDLTEDLHLEFLEVTNFSEAIGETIENLRFRENFGVNIISILRGHQRIDLPHHTEKIYPHDKILVVGKDDELKHVKLILEKEEHLVTHIPNRTKMIIHQLSIEPESKFVGKTIKENEFRTLYNTLVVCILRKGKFIMNPTSDTLIKQNDMLWIVGDKQIVGTIS